jgi:hypothetical protein
MPSTNSAAQDADPGPDTPLSGSDIVDALFPPAMQERIERLPSKERQGFTALVLRILDLAQLGPNSGSAQPTWRARKWQRKIKLWVPIEQVASLQDRALLANELTRLRDFVANHHGPDLELTSNPDEANFWIVFGTLGELQNSSVLKQVAQRFFSGNLEAVTRLTEKSDASNCAHHLSVIGSFGSATDNTIVQALSFINSETSKTMQTACLRRAFAFSVGFTDLGTGTAESWTQGNAGLSRPSELDGELLQLLYSKRVTPGLEAAPAVHVMLDEALTLYETGPALP